MSRSSSSNNASKNSSSKQTTTQTSASKKQNASSQMKMEIANEFGVKLGADATARENGQVGGEITKRLVKLAKDNMNEEN